MDKGPHLLDNYANMKSQRVMLDEPLVPALKDEATEIEHLLAEPKCEQVSVDNVFCFSKDNSGRCLGLEDFSYGFEFGYRTNYGGLNRCSTIGEDELKLEVLDGFLDDVDEVDDIHAANDLATACEDFLLDIEFTEKFSALDNCRSEASRLGNSSSESHSPGFSGSSNVATGISESSTGTVPESECKIDSLDKLVSCELHVNSGSKCGCQVPVEDNKSGSSSDVQKFDELDSNNCPNSYDVHKFDKLDNKCANSHDVHRFDELDTSKCPDSLHVHKFDDLDSNKCPSFPSMHESDDLDNDDNLLLSSILSKCKKRAKSSVLETNVKRLRKPTRRYIEEFSDLKSACHKGGQKDCTAALEKKHLKVKSHNESFDETHSQTPLQPWLRQRRVKKYASASSHASALKSESSDDYSASKSDADDLSASEPDGDSVRKKESTVGVVDRRKHQRMWTLSEVMKLIDGISQYGVGRWTDIKRLLFPSSTYRTPIDLRDKWRNLLKSSFSEKKNKREVQQKQVERTLPKQVIGRIRELATIHPYPRVSNSKISCNDRVALSKLLTKTKGAGGASYNPCQRNVGRKKHT